MILFLISGCGGIRFFKNLFGYSSFFCGNNGYIG